MTARPAPPRMMLDPEAVPAAADDAPACPTSPRVAAGMPVPLGAEAEARRRAGLSQTARRAFAEADARRMAAAGTVLPPELGGRDGPEPVRYGDWELKGLAIDF